MGGTHASSCDCLENQGSLGNFWQIPFWKYVELFVDGQPFQMIFWDKDFLGSLVRERGNEEEREKDKRVS